MRFDTAAYNCPGYIDICDSCYDVEACEAACAQNEQCNSFGLVKSEYRCYLKDHTSCDNQVENPDVVFKYKRFETISLLFYFLSGTLRRSLAKFAFSKRTL